jgi:hypothetical protein
VFTICATAATVAVIVVTAADDDDTIKMNCDPMSVFLSLSPSLCLSLSSLCDDAENKLVQ